MNELVENYLQFLLLNKGRSEGTVSKYRGYLEQLIAWCDEQGLNIIDLELSHLEEFTGKQAHENGLKPSARKPLVASVRGLYAWLYKNKAITENPAEHLSYPKFGRSMPTALQMSNAEKIFMQCDLETFKGVRDAAILSVLFGCGVRVSGLVNLNEGDLFFEPYQGQEHLVIKVREKGAKERLIPAPHETKFLLKAYLVHPELESINRDIDNDKVLFVSLNNHSIPSYEYHGERRRITSDGIRYILESYGEKAGVPRNQCNPHAARHMFGTELAENDINTATSQALMGHEDANSSQIYTHLAMRKLRKTIDKANPLSRLKTPIIDLLKALQHDK